MPEIFTRTGSVLAGVFSADTGRLSFGAGVPTVLVQNIGATYMQNVTRLYEVGNIGQKARVYYVGGRAQGQLQMARVVGPGVLLGAYYTKFGNVCFAKTNIIRFTLDQPDCSPGGAAVTVVYTCAACVITQVGISVAAQDMIINENSQLMFTGMDFAGN